MNYNPAPKMMPIPKVIKAKTPETWQGYLRRLGNGINGISERSKTVTEGDIISNAYKWMQIKYPGPYRVEQYYNAERARVDLRLKFDNPQEETMWLLRYS